MIAQAVIVSVIWLALAWSLDLSHSTATTGVVIAFLLAWRDERKQWQ